jgi:ketosteroid isomerase-like protein
LDLDRIDLVEKSAVVDWLNAYVKAWKSYSPDAIGSLFTDDATYSYHPFDEPVRGREAIVESWLKGQDPPGTYEATYAPIAVDGNIAVVQGRSRYFKDATRSELTRQWDNIFVIEFDDGGLCRSFSEWFVAPKGQSAT